LQKISQRWGLRFQTQNGLRRQISPRPPPKLSHLKNLGRHRGPHFYNSGASNEKPQQYKLKYVQVQYIISGKMKKTEAAVYFICSIYTIITVSIPLSRPPRKKWKKTFLEKRWFSEKNAYLTEFFKTFSCEKNFVICVSRLSDNLRLNILNEITK